MNVVDAAQTGALSMMSPVITVAVISFAFYCWVSWVNHTLEWFGDRVGVDGLSIEVLGEIVYILSLGPVSSACESLPTSLS